jgi:septum site-determining protein MinD
MLIVNRVRPKMVQRGDMLEIDDMLEMLAVDLLGIVPEDEHIIVSTNRGEPAVYHRESKAGQAYLNIARRLMGEQVPIMDLNADNGIWAKLKRIVGLSRG